VVLIAVGAAAAGMAALQQEMVYTSTATTSIVNAAERTSIDGAYSVTQAIRVTMPAYMAETTSSEVVRAAARASGLSTAEVAGRLVTSREPDSTVIAWTMTAPSASAAQGGLATAVTAFGNVVAAVSPQDSAHRALVTVRVNQIASEAVGRRPIALPLAIGAGAAAGALSAVALSLLRASRDQRITSRESIELGLNVPVVAELSKQPDERSKSWAYVAAYLAKSGVTGPVMVITGRRPFTIGDLKVLSRSVVTLTGRKGPHIKMPVSINDPQVPPAVLRAGAVMLVLTERVDDISALRPMVNSISNICVGPVFAVLDVNRASQRLQAPRERAATSGGEDLASQSTEWKLYPPLVKEGETIEIEASSGTSNGTKPTRELQSGLAKTQAAD
jgi:capsular polysaccharide biosynthesis protein